MQLHYFQNQYGYYVVTRDAVQAYCKTYGYTYLDEDRRLELFYVMKNECLTFQHFLENDLYAVDITDKLGNTLQSSGLIPGKDKATEIAKESLQRCENFSPTFNSEIF